MQRREIGGREIENGASVRLYTPTPMHFSTRCSRSSAVHASKSALAAARGLAALELPGHRKSRQDRFLSLRAAPCAGSGSRGSGWRCRRAGGGEGEGEGRGGDSGEGESREGERGWHQRRVRRLQCLREKIPRGFFANTKYYRISPSLYVIKY